MLEGIATKPLTTELKISCSIILWVVVPQNYGASMRGEKTRNYRVVILFESNRKTVIDSL